MIISDDLDYGHMGVKGFLWYYFGVKDAAGNMVHLPGYALVREHPDPARPGNPTRVFCWRVEEAARMCQSCSDRHGGPVDLAVHGCTKNTCSILAGERRVRLQQEEKGLLAAMPLLSNEDLVQARKPGNCSALPVVAPPPPRPVPRKPRAKSVAPSKAAKGAAPNPTNEVAPPPPPPPPCAPPNPTNEVAPTPPPPPPRRGKATREEKWVTTHEVREVRVVHGQPDGEGMQPEIWLYVSGNASDKSNHMRDGFWLYPLDNTVRRYYIGPLAPVQTSKSQTVADVAVFDNFPVTKVVQLNFKGKPKKHTILVTTDRPLTSAELLLARNGVDINEHDSQTSEVMAAEVMETTPAVAPLTAYEQNRLNNIQRNEAYLNALRIRSGDTNNSESVQAFAARKRHANETDATGSDGSYHASESEDDQQLRRGRNTRGRNTRLRPSSR